MGLIDKETLLPVHHSPGFAGSLDPCCHDDGSHNRLGTFRNTLICVRDGYFDADVTLEEDVAVILVAFGVFLEMREMLAKRAYGEEVAEKQHDLNELSERYGAYLLIIGLIMEINDQCFEPLLEDTFVAAFGIASMAFFDALALVMGLVFLAKLCVPSQPDYEDLSRERGVLRLNLL